jgi:hypothetical protein
MHVQLMLVRPLAQARHVKGAARRAGSRVQSGLPGEKPLLLFTTRSIPGGPRERVALVWAVKCAPWERVNKTWSDSDVSCLTSHCGVWPR